MNTLIEILKQTQNSVSLADMLPFCDILSDYKTITTKEQSVVQVIKLSGKDYTGLDDDELRRLLLQRTIFFESLDSSYNFSFHYHRKKYEIRNIKNPFSNKYARIIHDLETKKFNTAYITEVYIVVSFNETGFLNKSGFFSKNLEKEIEKLELNVMGITNKVDNIIANLSDYSPRVIYHSKHGKSELLEFWLYILRGGVEANVTPTSTKELFESLSTTAINFAAKDPKNIFAVINKEVQNENLTDLVAERIKKEVRKEFSAYGESYVVYQHPEQSQFSSFLSIKLYPDETTAKVLEGVMSTQCRFNLYQNVKPLTQMEALKEISERNRISANFGNQFQKQVRAKCEELGEDLADDLYTLVSHSLTICVYGETPEEVEHNVQLIERQLNKVHIIPIREDEHTQACFWSILPDGTALNEPRQKKIDSILASELINFGTKNLGNKKCAWGSDNLRYYKTLDGQNFGYTHHATEGEFDPANVLIISPTGGGKSTFLAESIRNTLKFSNPNSGESLKTLILDNELGLSIPVKVFEGDYNEINDSLLLNPMQLPENPENKRFLFEWLKSLLKVSDPVEEEILIKVINTNFEHFSKEERSLDALRSGFGAPKAIDPKTGKANLAFRAKQYLPNEDDRSTSAYPNGMVFNGKRDSLSFDKDIVAFDMTHLLSDETMLPPIASYIFHSFISNVITKEAPFVVVIDEAINFMHSPIMNKFIEDALLRFRKLKGCLICAVQGLELMMGNPETEKLLPNFQTFLIAPNSKAIKDDYCGSATKAGIGLSETEFYWVKNTTAKYQMMVKRPTGNTVILNVDLSDIGKYLNLYSSDRIKVNKANALIKKNKENWVEEFLK